MTLEMPIPNFVENGQLVENGSRVSRVYYFFFLRKVGCKFTIPLMQVYPNLKKSLPEPTTRA
jgi:hypothetical protein